MYQNCPTIFALSRIPSRRFSFCLPITRSLIFSLHLVCLSGIRNTISPGNLRRSYVPGREDSYYILEYYLNTTVNKRYELPTETTGCCNAMIPTG